MPAPVRVEMSTAALSMSPVAQRSLQLQVLMIFITALHSLFLVYIRVYLQ
jgi:hypothetical protein